MRYRQTELAEALEKLPPLQAGFMMAMAVDVYAQNTFTTGMKSCPKMFTDAGKRAIDILIERAA